MLEQFRIIKCKPLDNYQLEVMFADGLKDIIDLKHLVGKGVFKIWNNYEEFKKVKINPSKSLEATSVKISFLIAPTIFFPVGVP